MRISVVIVTHNRPEHCDSALNSLLDNRVVPNDIIVVDDHSIPPYSLRIKDQRVKIYRTDEELGLGYCRTLGAKAAEGDVIAFIDDDALASPNWIEKIEMNAIRYDIIGGTCKPIYAVKKLPEWWNPTLLGKYLTVNNDFLVGCNFAVRREVFEKVGYFRRILGRVSGKLISNEERDLILRARIAGKSVAFDRSMIVYHKILPYRMNLKYLIRRAWYQGFSIYLTVGTNFGLFLLGRDRKESKRNVFFDRTALRCTLYSSSIYVALMLTTVLGYVFCLLSRSILQNKANCADQRCT